MTERYREDLPRTTGISSSFAYGDYHSRISWAAIVAGAFVALALFVVCGVLATAFGWDYGLGTARTTGREAAAAVWGLITTLICFGAGGWIAGTISRREHRGSGTMNGVLVWAVAIPLFAIFFGATMGPALGRYASDANWNPAVQASARMDNAGMTAPDTAPDRQTNPVRKAAWWTLVSLGVGVLSAAFFAHMGAHSDEPRTTTGGTTTTTTTTT